MQSPGLCFRFLAQVGSQALDFFRQCEVLAASSCVRDSVFIAGLLYGTERTLERLPEWGPPS